MSKLNAALGRRPVVVLTGPRKCGKTTLARQILDPSEPTYFDLERIAVVYPGTRRYKRDDRVEAVPLASLAEPGGLFEEAQ